MTFTSTRTGIPTAYHDTRFRSRLEARWAAFFDLVGWSWVYEPLDAEGYIPDFLIQGEFPFFVEVGNCITRRDFREKAEKANRCIDQLGHDVLVVGVNPLPGLPGLRDHHPSAGWLGEFSSARRCDCEHPGDADCQHAEEGDYWWSAARWHRCRADRVRCGQIAIHHDEAHYASRPCGHYDGDHYLGYLDATEIEQLWRRAGNAVQWKTSA